MKYAAFPSILVRMLLTSESDTPEINFGTFIFVANSLTEHFTVFEPQNQAIVEICLVYVISPTYVYAHSSSQTFIQC